jgi:hypothetical protein
MMAACIIGIAGKAESGKDTAAGFITTVYPRHYYRRAFADALKRDAFAAWSRDHGPYTPDIVAAMPLARMLACANLLKSGNESFRTLLQDFGQVKRNGNPTYWIDRLFRDHANPANHHYRIGPQMVIPDVRFKNEAEAIIERGGLVIRLERPGHENRLTPEQRAHASETDLDDFPDSGHYRVIGNTGDPVDLLRKVLAEVDHANGWRR